MGSKPWLVLSLIDFNPHSFTILSLRTFQTQWQNPVIPALGNLRQEEKNASSKLSQVT